MADGFGRDDGGTAAEAVAEEIFGFFYAAQQLV